MDNDAFFRKLWDDYVEIAPRAAGIRAHFESLGETVVDDHVAFRTFDRDSISIAALEPQILGLGYVLSGEYRFEQKRLRARSYSPKAGNGPRVFLSELCVDEFDPAFGEVIDTLVSEVDTQSGMGLAYFYAGRPWAAPSFATYSRLAEVSEYAAWVAALGMRANHFTISINALNGFHTLESVLAEVEALGFSVNDSGGRVKGSPATRLEQASTIADRVPVEFAGGDHYVIPTCYYEFALRHEDGDGVLFDGFVADSADRIFESTHS